MSLNPPSTPSGRAIDKNAGTIYYRNHMGFIDYKSPNTGV